MKALVTGGAGFIGSHLAEALVHRGVAVTVLDDLSGGSEANLAWRLADAPVELVKGAVTDAALVARLLPGCDWVFHQAAMPSVPRSVAEPLLSNARNLDATLQLLVAARDAGVKRFVFASSSAIYGDSDVSPKHEGLPPHPLSPYGLQKYAAERYGQLFHQLYGLPTVALRYFNVFGPRQTFDSPYSGVIARFCTAFLRGEPPVIFGDGRQSRDFTYVDNVVAANLAAVEAPEAQVAGQVFNVAGGNSITLLDLVRSLSAISGRELPPVLHPARAGDVKHSRADISAAQRAFAYTPSVDWSEGLRRTYEWYRGKG
jgi:nucleoside-diphosphate-sugar epimerase